MMNMMIMTVAELAERTLIEKKYYWWWSIFPKQHQQTARGPTILLHQWPFMLDTRVHILAAVGVYATLIQRLVRCLEVRCIIR